MLQRTKLGPRRSTASCRRAATQRVRFGEERVLARPGARSSGCTRSPGPPLASSGAGVTTHPACPDTAGRAHAEVCGDVSPSFRHRRWVCMEPVMSVACPPLAPASGNQVFRPAGRRSTLLAPLVCVDFLAIRMLNGAMGPIVQTAPQIRLMRTWAERHGRRTHRRPSMPRSRCARDRPGRSAIRYGRRGTPFAITAPRRHA